MEGEKRVLRRTDTEGKASEQQAPSAFGLQWFLLGLTPLKQRLCLVQAGCLMAREGRQRAQVSEVLARAQALYGIEITPGEAGQHFSSLGMKTVTTHGKSRLVLDIASLEKIREPLEEEVEEHEELLKERGAVYDLTMKRVAELEERCAAIVRLASREAELKAYLDAYNRPGGTPVAVRGYSAGASFNRTPSALTTLQQRVSQLQAQVSQVKALEAQIKELEGKADKRGLEERRHKLEEEVAGLKQSKADLDREEAAFAEQEKAQANRIQQLQVRQRLVTLADVDLALAQARQELASLDSQLNEKRSLLSKVFGGRGS